MKIFLLASTVVVVALLGIRWYQQIGWQRAGIASICRLLWLVPLITTLFPQTVTTLQPDTFQQHAIHLLIDDSHSMAGAPLRIAKQVRHYLQERCHTCKVRISYLSKINPLTAKGYTPLSLILADWFKQVGDDAWLIITDGGDFQPQLAWNNISPTTSNKKGILLGIAPRESKNIWLTKVAQPPFAFTDNSTNLRLLLGQDQQDENLQAQVQLLLDDKILGSKNIRLQKQNTEVMLTIPPLQRGMHVITAKVLPIAEETTLWDNEVHIALEVLPDTTGVLHLLGSPSWDGSFIRRYLKSEPKYDLISFYILRDPWDYSSADTREMSLIPFPVDQLFGEELPNFKVVIMQNFSLYRFLTPLHQQNLVRHVRDGGGLLFIGGNRALTNDDVTNSPLAKILPFTLKSNKNNSYLPKKNFKVKLAIPSIKQREFASVYDDWLDMQTELQMFDSGKGLHQITLNNEAATPLLLAVDTQGKEYPLAVASYPERGRAIWLFSDSLWRLALASDSRYTYHQFLQRMMAWLLHQDLYQPLVSKNFILRRKQNLDLQWQLELHGAATKYFSPSPAWQLELCGQQLDWRNITIENNGIHRLLLQGQLPANNKKQCRAAVFGTNKAFGSLYTSSVGVLPEMLSDKQVGGSMPKLTSLAKHLQVPLLLSPVQFISEISLALRRWLPEEKTVAHTQAEHYWLLTKWYYLLFLLFLPLEVWVRRSVSTYNMRGGFPPPRAPPPVSM